MPKKPNEIGQRLRQWSATQFPSLAAFARALGWIPQNLTPYLNGTILPGNALQAKLRKLGCDIEWLMTGKTTYEGKRNPGGNLSEPPAGYDLPADLKERKEMFQLIKALNKLKKADRDKVVKIVRTFFPSAK
jgi:transcriptional regulator with XRE-family HTH domain